MSAGNREPWKERPRLKHKTVIHPHEVELNEVGDIIDMPLLDKWCFGKMETLLRHGETKRKGGFKTKYGTNVDVLTHCGRCPAPTRQSCAKVVTHRVRANPAIHAAFKAWMDCCRRDHGGTPVYSGPGAGELWVAFKKEIAKRGPFKSANDQKLQDERDRKRAEQTEKWRMQKQRQRERDREKRRKRRQAPDEQFVRNALNERDARRAVLEAALGDPKFPKCISKVPLAFQSSTAALTANAWLLLILLRASGDSARDGTIARRLFELGMNEGKPLQTLKERIGRDLERGFECERIGIWTPFNADGDLEHYSEPDDDSADSLQRPVDSIDDILDELAALPIPSIDP